MENDVLDVVVWEAGKGDDIVSDENPDFTKEFMKRVDRVAENLGHRYCFWVLGQYKPIVGSTNNLGQIDELVAHLCLVLGIPTFAHLCNEEVWAAIQAADVERAQRECPPKNNLQ
jgi:hypothetical protein